MKIALIGASGFVGSALRKEALARNHQVTALVSHPEKIPSQTNLAAIQVDVQNETALAEKLGNHDAVISAFSGHAQDNIYDYYVQGIRSIIAATKSAAVPRLLVVGGAGSLEVSPGVQLADTPTFPAQWQATAKGARQALVLLEQEQTLNWTMLCPSALLQPGMRTGKFRLGTNQLLIDDKGESHISVEDYAVAMMDELEKPAHARQRFTVGY